VFFAELFMASPSHLNLGFVRNVCTVRVPGGVPCYDVSVGLPAIRKRVYQLRLSVTILLWGDHPSNGLTACQKRSLSYGLKTSNIKFI
jgi:hypothetical protein